MLIAKVCKHPAHFSSAAAAPSLGPAESAARSGNPRPRAGVQAIAYVSEARLHPIGYAAHSFLAQLTITPRFVGGLGLGLGGGGGFGAGDDTP